MLFMLLLLADPPAVTDLSRTLAGLLTIPIPLYGVPVALLGALVSVANEKGWSLARKAVATFFGALAGWVLSLAIQETFGLGWPALGLYYYLSAMGYGLSGGAKTIGKKFTDDPIGTAKQLVLLKKDFTNEKPVDNSLAGLGPDADRADQP